MKKISKNITYEEAVRSNTATRKGIQNTPGPKELKAMKNLSKNVFQPLREYFGKPIIIDSFFRCIRLNRLIGGSITSQHCLGEAMDIRATKGFTNKQIFFYIKNNLDFDQLIYEFGDKNNPAWVHVSYKLTHKNRGQVLRAVRKNGKTYYLPWKE